MPGNRFMIVLMHLVDAYVSTIAFLDYVVGKYQDCGGL